MSSDNSGDRILEGLLKTLQMSLQYGDPEDADIEQYKKLAKKTCEIEHNNFVAQDEIKEAAKANSVEEFEDNMAARTTGSKTFNPKNSKRYMDFVKRAEMMVRVHNGADSETEMNVDVDDANQVNTHIVDIDPITKTPLEHPVRNKICKHIYGKESVLQCLQTNPRLRCPIMGCANKQFVKMSDLIEDEDIAFILTAQRRRAAQNK